MRNWNPDVEVDGSIAHRLVSAQFPDFAELVPQFLGRGWDNYCVEYPNGVVFRLPTRSEGARILLNEISVLPSLVGLLTVTIPQPIYRGSPSPDYPYPFIGYLKIAGSPADQLIWSANERRTAAPILGRFLSELHRIPISSSPFEGLATDLTGKANPARLLKGIRTRFQQLEAQDGMTRSLLSQALRMSEQLAARPAQLAETRLVHGDLYPRHILADDRKQVTGIIDWGDVHLGDPAIDLSLAYTFFEPEERHEFWMAYGREASEFNTQVLLLRAAMYGFALMAYGLDENDLASAKTGEQILHRLVSG
jgi:aminoglycoside phosphotransferase (APT) family kinase protein